MPLSISAPYTLRHIRRLGIARNCPKAMCFPINQIYVRLQRPTVLGKDRNTNRSLQTLQESANSVITHDLPRGDLVPLGFLLLGLTSTSPETDTVESRLSVSISQVVNKLRCRLLKSREGKSYAFHTGRLTTATDSALVMLGIGLKESHDVEVLEAFSDGRGGYFPQLWATSLPLSKYTGLRRVIRVAPYIDQLKPDHPLSVL